VAKLNVGSVIPIALGIWGMVDQYTKDRKTWVMLFVTTMVMSIGLILFLNFSDSEVRERDYFYSPAFYYFAVYIGIGAASLLHELRGMLSRRGARPAPAVYGFAVVLVVLPMFTLKTHYFSHDRSNNYTCPAYARNMLIGLEENSILFTYGDNDTFPLWYIQEVEGYRTDVKVVNLSLLNTAWYIQQCRDNEPKVPITWTDDEVARLRPIRTQDGRGMSVAAIAMDHILRANDWKQPIYISVTVKRDAYEAYLEILEYEGLAYKVVRRRGENMVNAEKLADNVTNKYDYSCILDENWKRDESVHLPHHTQNLIINYANAFIQLAVSQRRDSLFADAARYMEAAHNISPDYPPPLELLGWYYLDIGDTTRALRFYEDQVERQPGNVGIRYRLAGAYERTGRYLEALEQLDFIMRLDPDNREAAMASVGLAMRLDMVPRARTVLTNWLRRHPEDLGAKQTLDDLSRYGSDDNSGQ
jgi:tetratricopeptide (TPR) repeat protein